MPEKKDFIIKDKRIFAEEDKEQKEHIFVNKYRNTYILLPEAIR